MGNPGGKNEIGSHATVPNWVQETEAEVQIKEKGGGLDRVWETGPMPLTRFYTFLYGYDWLLDRSKVGIISVGGNSG